MFDPVNVFLNQRDFWNDTTAGTKFAVVIGGCVSAIFLRIVTAQYESMGYAIIPKSLGKYEFIAMCSFAVCVLANHVVVERMRKLPEKDGRL